MAWAALIPVALELLKGDEKQPQGPAMPQGPTLGDIFKNNVQPVAPHTFPNSQPFNAGPVGGGNRGY